MAGYTVGQQIGINAASSAVGGLVGLATSALQHHYNKKLSEKQFEQNVAMWNMQNEYNSPVAQRKRLEEAGLNPALMYQNGASAGNATSMPQYQAFGQSLSQNLLDGMQMAQISANIRKTNAEAENEENKSPFVALEAQAIIDNYIADADVKRSTIRKMSAEISKMEIEGRKLEQDILVGIEDVKLKIAQTASEEERRKLTELQEGLVILQKSLTSQQIKTEEEATRTQEAQTEYVKQQKATAKAQGDMYNAEAGLARERKKTEGKNYELVEANALYKQWENDYMERTGRKPDANLTQSILQWIGKNRRVPSQDYETKAVGETKSTGNSWIDKTAESTMD